MCSIIGALAWSMGPGQAKNLNSILNGVFEASIERGRDGYGFYRISRSFEHVDAHMENRQARRTESWDHEVPFFPGPMHVGALVANLRAEPTTEYVMEKRDSDQQPYTVGPWTIVHNGTIANDKELRTHELPTSIDSAAIAELLGSNHMRSGTAEEVAEHFASCIDKLKGSYAILAIHHDHPGMVLAACNYRPIWYVGTDSAVLFASARHYLPATAVPEMLPAYSAWAITPAGRTALRTQPEHKGRALVVCSGGLDSVTAAAYAKAEGWEIELVHFMYGSRAEGPEVKAVKDVAEAMDVPYRFFAIPIYKPEDSPLLQADSTIAGGEEGAEFAHEWVPARNLVMLSIATAMAEAGGFDTIILGNNLEEAGAYPDNEPEFISRFNDMLPFAVADGKRVRVAMPVGNLMKHEIVALGHKVGAPLDKTWSCYRAGEQHCGTCGPCFMRRTAFHINGLPEVITYANEEK